MNPIILNVLCEGQTEDKFVNDVLRPYLKDYGIIVKHRLLVTSRKKGAKGGIISYQQVKGDLLRWQKEVQHNPGETHWFTTMFDFYALPVDFPGQEMITAITDAYNKVETLESEFLKDLNVMHFIPFIQLHEFEALLFSDLTKLKIDYSKCSKEIDELNNILKKTYHGNPELVNTGVNTAPSKRIIKAIEGKKKYSYNKPMTGAKITQLIGIENLSRKCCHFGDWIKQILQIVHN